MEQILEKLGNPGRYHMLLVCMFAITWWSVCLGTVSMAFYGYTGNFTCNLVDSLSANGMSSNASHKALLTNNITVADDQCEYTIHSIDSSPLKQKCRSWIFDDEGRGTRTIAIEWSLVCSDRYKTSLSSTIFFIGVFVGALLFGFISDRWGRKKTLALCLYTHMPISLAIAFMPDYITFTALRFVLGVWLQGISTVAFVHCVEFFRQKYRGVVMSGFGISWAFAQVLAALLAYIFPNWRHMQIASSMVAVITIPYFWWLPESPRWLLVKGKFEEISRQFIARAARMNKLDEQHLTTWSCQQFEKISQQQTLAASTERPQSFINVLRTPKLGLRLLAMCYMWCVASMTYYAFIFNTRNLDGDRYINFAIGAALEVIVNLVIIFIMMRFGRRKPLMTACIALTIFCLIMGTVPKTVGTTNISWIITLFALLGKMAISAVMSFVFVYAAELFPTFARGGCMALCGCSLRVGGMLAPQILYLRQWVAQLPYIIIAMLIFSCGILTCFLPETHGCRMPNTIAEAVEMLPEPTDKAKKIRKDDSQDSEASRGNADELKKMTEAL